MESDGASLSPRTATDIADETNIEIPRLNDFRETLGEGDAAEEK